MPNSDYQLADFKDKTNALEEITHLEQKLSEQYGTEVVLIAYTAEENESTPQ